jgi:hypothetical protein
VRGFERTAGGALQMFTLGATDQRARALDEAWPLAVRCPRGKAQLGGLSDVSVLQAAWAVMPRVSMRNAAVIT